MKKSDAGNWNEKCRKKYEAQKQSDLIVVCLSLIFFICLAVGGVI